MEAAGWSGSAAALVAPPPFVGRLRHGWPLAAPTNLPFAPSSSPSFPRSVPFIRGFASEASQPRSLLSSLPQQPPIRLRVRVVAGAALQDAAATAFCFAGAYSLIRAFDALNERNIIQKSLSRKVVHVLSGLLYMAAWPLFSTSAEARYFAAVVPFLNCIRILCYGLRLLKDESLVKSVTRQGRPEELLQGPLYFVIMLLLCVLVFWRDSPVGIVSLAMMSGGDGFADIVGRRVGSVKLPYNQQKSWAGSISMFVFGFLFSVGMLYYFSTFGYFEFSMQQTAARVAVVALTATLVESLPISHVMDDNISVPLTSLLTAALLFQS